MEVRWFYIHAILRKVFRRITDIPFRNKPITAIINIKSVCIIWGFVNLIIDSLIKTRDTIKRNIELKRDAIISALFPPKVNLYELSLFENLIAIKLITIEIVSDKLWNESERSDKLLEKIPPRSSEVKIKEI